MDEKIKRRQLAKQRELKKFLKITCGKEFCRILFLGSDNHLCCQFSSLKIVTSAPPDSPDKTKIHWEINVKGSHPLPYGDDPFVLAAMFKIYLSQQMFNVDFTFTINQIIDELGLELNDENEERVAEVIERYFQLRYTARVVNPKQNESSFDELSTTLFSQYKSRSEKVNKSFSSLRREYERISWNESFALGLRDQKVVLLGINLGPLNLTFQ